MINSFARANTEAEIDRWLARLIYIKDMTKALEGFVAVGERLEDCLTTGESRDRRTHMSSAVDEMKMALDSLEREEARIRRELDDRGIAP